MPRSGDRVPRHAIGLDVGSTTVKAVVVEPSAGGVLWSTYLRHETRQAERVCDVLEEVQARFGADLADYRLYLTGSGARALAGDLGGWYVQEVNAVALAVERLHPEVSTVVELGGQDAKMIVWTPDPATGARRRFSTMNDRCAGGTGAVLDKIRPKLGLDEAATQSVQYDPARLHPVAGKCGVFAETDIVGLQKQGVAAADLLASLCEAIVQQNLSVLARGQVLRPAVLLLGGPNQFLPVLQAAWRANLVAHWKERGVAVQTEAARLVIVPEGAVYFPALGAVFQGLEEAPPAEFRGPGPLRRSAGEGRRPSSTDCAPGIVQDEAEAADFLARHAVPAFSPPPLLRGTVVPAFLGIDAGSTSTKGVLLDPAGRLLGKAYRLSAGNPMEDTREILRALHSGVEAAGAALQVAGVGVTGYAKDILRDVIGADVAVVETVAHARSAARLWPEVEVVCDVGGQDIKVLFLRRGRIWDFRLNTQCSAGTGYFLQATARRFGIPVEEFAASAFGARRAPRFHFGCAVFLETDIVNAQQLGWAREEILAGLAQVLPRNIWLYVVQEPNLGRFGRRVLLQGGTQRNAAALKAQMDFIRARVPDAEVRVHDHPGECGAIGAALEALRSAGSGPSRFVGFEALERLAVQVVRDESTRCQYCRNACLRTFIRATAPDGTERRFIAATCERGAQDDPEAVRQAHRRMKMASERSPNLVEVSARRAFQGFEPAPAARGGGDREGGAGPAAKRARLRVGIPRALNLYSVAPFFTAYLESLGIPFRQIVFSDVTSEALFRQGSRRGAIDPCFPAKVALAHVHQLLSPRRVDVLFFPRLASLPTFLEGVQDSMACPTVAASADVVRAALSRDPDLLAAAGVQFLGPTLHMAEPALFSRQLFAAWRSLLDLSAAEHAHAMREGWRAIERFLAEMRAHGSRVLAQLEAEGGLGVVVLGRPYHNDPGINHMIAEEIQRLGYPVLPIEALPLDDARMARLVQSGAPDDGGAGALSVRDLWTDTFSENSNRKLWGAKYAARHPNLVAADLSSFRCGHDAPISDVIRRVLEDSGTPYFTFHDLDENRPAGAIRLRIETLGYFLRRFADSLREGREVRPDATPGPVHV